MLRTDEVDAGPLLATVVVVVLSTGTGLVGVTDGSGFLLLSAEPFGK